jgi:hypothetical protein
MIVPERRARSLEGGRFFALLVIDGSWPLDSKALGIDRHTAVKCAAD